MSKVATFPAEGRNIKTARVELKTSPDLKDMLREAAVAAAGQDLLYEFFQHIKIIHEALPIKGVYLDADPGAVNFYTRLGFAELTAPPNAFGAIPMFLGIQHILAA